MDRRWTTAVVLAAALGAAGCGDRNEGGTVVEDGAVPPGAIPAAPDQRPGSEAVQGGVSQPGATTDSVTNVAPAATAPASDSIR